MKKLFTVILFLVSLSGYSQILIGPKAGFNLASQFKSDYTMPKTGAAFGGALNMLFTTNISIQGEFLVSQKGYREVFKGDSIYDELTATYLEVPAMVKYTIDNVNFDFYGMAGVYWSYWSKGNFESSLDGENIKYEDYPFQGDYDQDGYKDIRNDFGLVGEIGVTYDNIGSGVLALGIRYSYGLIQTNNHQNPPPDLVSRENKVITISLTYFMYL